MVTNCKNCNEVPGLAAELLQMVKQGDTPRMLNILTEVLTSDPHMHQEDRCQLGMMMHLLIAVMKQKDADHQQEIAALKAAR